MRRKHMLPMFMLSMGAALLVAATAVGVAASATHSQSKHHPAGGLKGGVLKVNQSAGTFDTLDPQLAYVSNDWGLLYSTQRLLVNYPDKPGAAGTQLFPDAATGFPIVSKYGKKYIFHLRSGMRFSDGSKVTPAAFVRAWERCLSPKMGSPYCPFDGFDKDVVGAAAYNAGKAKSISGIKTKGNTLTFFLTHPVPYFTSALAMQWFGAVKPNMAFSKTGINHYPSAGPYYIAAANLNRTVVLKRNKYYNGKMPANPNEMVFTNNTDQHTSLLQTEKGQVDLDMAGPVATDVSGIISKFGVNRSGGQFHVAPTTCIDWVAFNTVNPPTSSLAVRKALNYIIGRNQLINLIGPKFGTPSDQILVPGIPGYKKFTAYPPNSNVAKGRSIGGSTLTNGSYDVYYNGQSPTQQNMAALIQNELERAGVSGSKITLEGETTGDYYGPIMTKGTHYNIAVHGGWCADYRDPYDYINVNFDGRTIEANNNTDYMYFNSAKFNAEMDAAATKSGKARVAAYAALDKTLMSQYVPMEPWTIVNSRILTSKRVKNWLYSAWYGYPVFNALSVG
jgi:peptide/nickel transport system substrate-binding protein